MTQGLILAEGSENGSRHASRGSLRADSSLSRAYSYFRRHGCRARESWLLARAEAWSTEQGLELAHGSAPNGDPVAALEAKTWDEEMPPDRQGERWSRRAQIVMFRPAGTDRMVAALMAMLLKETKR